MGFKAAQLLIAGSFILALASIGNSDANTREFAALLPGPKVIEVKSEPTPVLAPVRCNVMENLDNEDDEKLTALELQVGNEDIIYSEDRVAVIGSRLILAKNSSSEPSKEIALKILNLRTCSVDIVVVTKVGERLIAPSGWYIRPVTRQNGIRWNTWNTEYEVLVPGDSVVIKNKYPIVTRKTVSKKIKTKTGITRTVWETVREKEYRLYAPYSQAVHLPQVVERGRQYLTILIENAYEELRRKKVYSRAFPDKLVVDVPVFSRASFERLPIIEHGDLAEFMDDPRRTSERVLVLLGLNGPNTFSYTCSSASACGMYQFTDNGIQGTYTTIRKKYAKANLMKDFGEGARNHLNVAQAAILLYDNNLGYLMNRYGEDIAKDPRLEEYLAAMYNASPKSVVNSISPALSAKRWEWTGNLLTETKGYIVKLRYLIENNFFTPSVMQPPIKG